MFVGEMFWDIGKFMGVFFLYCFEALCGYFFLPSSPLLLLTRML